MRKFTALAVAVSATFAVSSAQAVFLSVDDFNSPALTLFDVSLGAGVNMFGTVNGVPAFPAPPTNFGTNYSDASRTIVHNWTQNIGGGGNNNGGNKSAVTMGSDASPTGALSMSNADQNVGIVDLTWTLAPGYVPASGPVSFFFQVVGSDNVNKQLSYSLDGGTTFTFISNYSTIAPPTQPLAVALTDPQKVQLNAGGNFMLRITGDAGWDMSIDSFGFQVPEPATLALVGLALMGAGFASRRRNAA